MIRSDAYANKTCIVTRHSTEKNSATTKKGDSSDENDSVNKIYSF